MTIFSNIPAKTLKILFEQLVNIHTTLVRFEDSDKNLIEAVVYKSTVITEDPCKLNTITFTDLETQITYTIPAKSLVFACVLDRING